MSGLLEAQEVAAAIADVVCTAYALESVALRVAKIRASGANGTETAETLAKAATIGHCETAARAARCTLDCLEQKSVPSPIAALVEGLLTPVENPMHLRRELASIVLERGGYPLA
jgi:hypothetical protein